MPDEFIPEASVDFEAIAAMAAAELAANGNGDGPHYTPPPPAAEPERPPIRPRAHADTNKPPASGPSLGLDPFQALEKIVGDQSLMFRELGDINAKLAVLQLQTIVAFGTALLLAALVWRFAHPPA